MEEVILFVMTFVLLFIIYQIVFIVPQKKRVEKKENKKELLEIRYLKSKYNLDFDKINYNQLL